MASHLGLPKWRLQRRPRSDRPCSGDGATDAVCKATAIGIKDRQPIESFVTEVLAERRSLQFLPEMVDACSMQQLSEINSLRFSLLKICCFSSSDQTNSPTTCAAVTKLSVLLIYEPVTPCSGRGDGQSMGLSFHRCAHQEQRQPAPPVPDRPNQSSTRNTLSTQPHRMRQGLTYGSRNVCWCHGAVLEHTE